MQLIMLRGFKFGVVLTLLLTVLTAQIAPTIDLPETTLRDHRVVSSHSSGEHSPGGFSIVSSVSHLQWSTFENEERLSPETQTSDHARVASARVLRC